MLAAQSVLLDDYLSWFSSLFKDRRTLSTFGCVVGGILGAGSLVCSRIAAQAPLLSSVRDGAQRVLRFATGESTTRSMQPSETATRLVEKLAQRGINSLGETPRGTQRHRDMVDHGRVRVA